MNWLNKLFLSTKVMCLVFMLPVFTACNSKKNVAADPPVVKLDLSADTAPIFDILQEPVLINLSSDSTLIGDISQILAAGDHIFLLSKNGGNNSITILNRQNNELKQISRTGRGPLEYLGVQNIFIDKNRLGALDHANGKIVYFDLDGNVLGERTTPKKFMYFWSTHNGYVGDMGNFGEDENSRDNMWIMDSSFMLRNSFFEIPSSWESIDSQRQPFSSYRDRTYYTRIMDNNIYSVDNEDIDARYSLDFGENNWPNPQAGYEQSVEINRNFPGHYVSKFDRVQETDQYLIVQFLHNGQVRLGVYDKTSNEAVVRHPDVYIGKYFIPFGTIAGMDEEAIYTVIDADKIKRLWVGKDEYNDFEADYPEQIRRLREEFPTIDEFGNPFLVIWKFK